MLLFSDKFYGNDLEISEIELKFFPIRRYYRAL
jgi:hypothetical protein